MWPLPPPLSPTTLPRTPARRTAGRGLPLLPTRATTPTPTSGIRPPPPGTRASANGIESAQGIRVTSAPGASPRGNASAPTAATSGAPYAPGPRRGEINPGPPDPACRCRPVACRGRPCNPMTARRSCRPTLARRAPDRRRRGPRPEPGGVLVSVEHAGTTPTVPLGVNRYSFPSASPGTGQTHPWRVENGSFVVSTWDAFPRCSGFLITARILYLHFRCGARGTGVSASRAGGKGTPSRAKHIPSGPPALSSDFSGTLLGTWTVGGDAGKEEIRLEKERSTMHTTTLRHEHTI